MMNPFLKNNININANISYIGRIEHNKERERERGLQEIFRIKAPENPIRPSITATKTFEDLPYH